MGQRTRDTGIYSATTGLCFLLAGIASLQITIFYALFYAEEDIRQAVTFVGDVCIMAGLVGFVVFVEIDQVRETSGNLPPERPYRFTKIALVIIAILIPVTIFVSDLRFLLFVLEIFPAAFTARNFIRNFRNMEMVKRTEAPQQFLAGMIITGLSNFLPAFHLIFSFWIFGITSAVIVVGAFLMVAAWAHFPRLEDLQWLRNLDRLIVFEKLGGLPLYEHTFRSAPSTLGEKILSLDPGVLDPSEVPRLLNTTLTTGAMTGIDSLLGEILASKGHVKEIDYGEKQVIFYRGEHAIFMLVVGAPSQEYQYRLEMFAIAFEKQYTKDFLKNKNDPTVFRGADLFLRKYFS